MKSLPLPLRVAAGLAATAFEQARDLPTRIAGLPVTVASQALQVSMRVQQHVTELAIKGDEALAALRPVPDEPEWATFDEDIEGDLAHRVPDEDCVAFDHEDAAPAGLADYSELSLAQLRSRLRGFDADALEELLAFERANANRPSYIGMLTRRLATVRDSSGDAASADKSAGDTDPTDPTDA
ncbi:lipid droplet-associated protein [Actinokineospora inagensis]|uniref:lipid droplet-associated protein n=1 Tax=Actinokineospora inagensis TaxID=103730 RepID=UPI0003FAB7B2|nr:lipid droplet-associated protein [Actinokineospora inagensis]